MIPDQQHQQPAVYAPSTGITGPVKSYAPRTSSVLLVLFILTVVGWIWLHIFAGLGTRGRVIMALVTIALLAWGVHEVSGYFQTINAEREATDACWYKYNRPNC